MDFESDILRRVKQRILGEPNAETADTQVIPDFSASILFQPEPKPQPQPAAIKLPQLPLDEAEFAPTQVIRPAETQILESQDAQVDAPTQNLKTQETETALETEVTRASLTDEENELNEADRTLDSSVQKIVTTKRELAQIERDLSEQKRSRNIQPVFEKKNTNPVLQLLAAFDSDSDDNALQSEPMLKLSPTTSPIKNFTKPLAQDSDSDSDFDTANVLDLISNTQQPATPKKKNPIDEYAQKLRKRMLSSPTRAEDEVITLDDSADERTSNEKENEVPELSKEQRLLIKQRFSKKKNASKSAFRSKFHQPAKSDKSLFENLRKANAKQLLDIKKANPDAELIEEIERDEEEMGNLLEREMERVRRIRKKEKQKEKALKALLEKGTDLDADYEENNEPASEVPDSEVDENSASENEESDSQDEESGERVHTKTRRIVMSDDEEQVDAEEEADIQRNDDSYMFGGHRDSNAGSEAEILQIQSQFQRSDSPFKETIEKEIEGAATELYKLFLNLAPRGDSQVSLNNSITEDSIPVVAEAPSFQDITSTQATLDLDTVLPTQVDTQSINQDAADPYSDDEDDIPQAIQRGRRLISKNSVGALPDVEEESEEEDEETKQELLRQKLAIYEAKIRRKELKARKLRKEMERKGMKGVVEGEAEESDDEWKGIGGADAEVSDQADSEDEKMIDNDFNLDLNDEEVRKKFMEQYQIKDRKELEKLIDDIKNHKLSKRANANRFDIELSDEEDEILMAYRRQKLEEQKKRLAANQKLMKLLKNEKSKAFFDSIQEEVISVVLDDDEDMSAAENAEGNAEQQDTQEDLVEPVKKSIRIEEAFVQRQLSFLSKNDDDDYFSIQKQSNLQHGVDLDEDIEDISALKSRCLSNLFSKSETPVSLDEEEPKKRNHDVLTDDDDDDDDFSHVFKKPSIVTSFRSFQEKQGVQVSTGSFTGVTVNKQYKVASGSRASITYMSNASKTTKTTSGTKFRSVKAKSIEESVDKAKLESKRTVLFGSGSSFA